MLFIVGILVVIGSVIGGYSVHGDVSVLWQPLEFVIIFGGAFGAFLISNPMKVVKGCGKAMGFVVKGPKYNKAAYEELLGVLFSVFKLAKTKGDLALETHVEAPDDSPLFSNFPGFQKDHHAVEFLCDYLRILTLGASNPHEIEAVMEAELDLHHEEDAAVSGAVLSMGDAMPALGIVAAVLGVIVTMSSITEPPEILGGLIAAALVGTFAGIFLSYGFVTPMGKSIESAFAADTSYLNCIKTAIIGHMQGYAPQISVEFARKTLTSDVRPTFAEVEEMIGNLPT
ncbi:MAG: flagellar motor stator protein MotA [Rhodospirillales bacterium]|nr:flagellar motor stator protein MotA [Alphaproteobacteria bacterium]MBL6947760.1 flagellar motor stator protein MotA [Rhodospirillales bacterium]